MSSGPIQYQFFGNLKESSEILVTSPNTHFKLDEEYLRKVPWGRSCGDIQDDHTVPLGTRLGYY